MGTQVNLKKGDVKKQGQTKQTQTEKTRDSCHLGEKQKGKGEWGRRRAKGSPLRGVKKSDNHSRNGMEPPAGGWGTSLEMDPQVWPCENQRRGVS